MKPICVPCHRFFKPEKNGFYFLEGMPSTDEGARLRGKDGKGHWEPYKLWCGDLWKCPGCGSEIISGVGRAELAEHFQEDFADKVNRLHAEDFQVNDC